MEKEFTTTEAERRAKAKWQDKNRKKVITIVKKVTQKHLLEKALPKKT